MQSPPENPPAAPLSEPAAPRARGAGLLYLFLLAALLAAVAWGLGAYPRWFARHQQEQPRYAAERALEALKAGQPEQARAQVAYLLKERPIYIGGLFGLQFSEVYEGPVLRNRVLIYLDLAAALIQAGMLPEAEQVLWKTLQEFHMASRLTELLPPWEMLFLVKYLQALQPHPAPFSAASLIEVARILGAQGVDQVRLPSKIHPFEWPVDDARFAPLQNEPAKALIRGLAAADQAASPGDYARALDLLGQAARGTRLPELRRGLQFEIHRLLLAQDRRADARQLLGRLWQRDPAAADALWQSPAANSAAQLERDPTLAGFYWRDRPATATLSLLGFLDSFKQDPRCQLLDFSALALRQEGYFQPRNKFQLETGRVLLYQSVAAEMPFDLATPVRGISLAYRATGALGLAPIVLLRIDDQPMLPLYLNEAEGLRAFECDVPPGHHRLELIYLNDAGYIWPARNIKEDRGVWLDRLLLTHIPPPDINP